MTATDPFFLDTNILVYAYNTKDGERHEIAKTLMNDCIEGRRHLVVSNQILAEFNRVVRYKLEHPFPPELVQRIISQINRLPSCKKINYTTHTVEKAFINGQSNSPWDALIAQTMKENGIVHIYTENTKDFQKMDGIVAINPFK
ncbi:MAG: PIN domain-containing protein [Candidatus Diapherotrites archaeon]|nr:PIN domain-containing protein [Candidatus Diapherotrites archaeon]